jgi:hypothetical protein
MMEPLWKKISNLESKNTNVSTAGASADEQRDNGQKSLKAPFVSFHFEELEFYY